MKTSIKIILGILIISTMIFAGCTPNIEENETTNDNQNNDNIENNINNDESQTNQETQYNEELEEELDSVVIEDSNDEVEIGELI
jgi:outer membrane murein-binding lipoprotein Lpp